jgi:hypothetical protein
MQGDNSMKIVQQSSKAASKPSPKRDHVYEAPAVVYEGVITTRAGTPIGGEQDGADVDPADLFGN